MMDGPFKNLKLGNHWKRFLEAAQNDVVDMATCCALASDAVVHEILDENHPLLDNLYTYGCREQLDIDPLFSIENIFNRHNRASFADFLQKELGFRLNDQMSLSPAIEQALKATMSQQISAAGNRIEEECIYACESGKMEWGQLASIMTRVRAIFGALDRDEIYDALRSGNKNAFKDVASKKEGLDEGPPL